MKEIPKGTEEQNNTWQPIKYPPARKMVWAEFTCPFGHGSSIGRKYHTVAPDGTVSPSIICSHADVKVGEKCTYHEFVRLLDWNPKDAEFEEEI